MYKISFILLLSFWVSVASAQDVKQKPQKQKTEQTTKKAKPVKGCVYICNGPKSLRYHKTSTCRGLSRCSTEIQKVSQSAAVKEGRTPCKICYK